MNMGQTNKQSVAVVKTQNPKKEKKENFKT
jgi:hypothetical protein